MSDFDKEAEREKLRKKFADDEEKRAGTRRMSELLLKGATMTNKHCGRCSDPLFRYDGQTFCPSCQANGAAVQDEPPVQGEPQAQDQSAAEPKTETVSEAPPETGGESPQPESPPVETESRTPSPNPAEPTQSPQPQREQSAQPQPPERASPVGDQHQKTQVGDLTDARQSLQRTVTRFAQAAEGTDDPRRARELLAAAREAAATLSELG